MSNKNKMLIPQNIAISAMMNWQIDEEFLDRALGESERRNVVSLDIFDTALTRLYDSPVDVFAEVESRLCKRYGKLASGFAIAREQAERVARQNHHKDTGAEEISFHDIYLELHALLPQFRFLDVASATELAVEMECLQPVPDILELTRRLNAVGKPYIFVSDMYLSSGFLESLLKHAGFENWQKIFVSCEHRATKASGRIWQVVGRTFPITSLLHIGDNELSDVLNPQSLGIASLGYERARSEHRLGARLTPDVLPFSRLQRHVELGSRHAVSTKASNPDRWVNMGRSLGGLTLATFTNWLAERSQLHKIDTLYFCARDGYLMKLAWEAAGLDKTLPVRAKYLYISRATLNMAAGVMESTPTRLSKSFLSFLSSSTGQTTVKNALDRAHLSDVGPLIEEARHIFGSLEAVLTWTGTCLEFENLLQRHTSRILEALKPHLDSTIAYLKQEGMLDAGRHAMVDMGWHGSMQSSLRKLIRASGGPSEIFGFYYGLWPAALKNRYAAGVMEACFGNEFMSLQAQAELHQSVSLLEQLHSAPHGTTKGYHAMDDGRIVPTFAANPLEAKQFELATRWFQQGAIDTVTSLFNGHRNALPVELADLKDHAVLAALGSVILSPSARDLEILSQIGHCATFDHLTHQPILRNDFPDDMEQMRSVCASSEWKIGQAKHWWYMADARQRQKITALTNSEIFPFDERIKRQFN
jgi:predicted HAD superfamily hydrolase